MTYEEYLTLINQECDIALQHPFASLLDDGQKAVFRLAFLNGCHAMKKHYADTIADLEKPDSELC